MKKLKKKIVMGAMLAGSSILSGCRLVPQNVYGPPPEEIETVIPEPVYGPPSDVYDPSTNIPEDVYGPPSYWDGPEEPEAEEETEIFEVDENVPVCVYGPPEYFEQQNGNDGKAE